jgi:hypothetical protein
MMMLKRISLALAIALGAFISAIEPASAKTISNQHYVAPNGYTQGQYSWIDCGGSGANRCREGIPDGRTTVADWGTDGRPARVWVHAWINGTPYEYLDKWVPDGFTSHFLSGVPPKDATVRVKVCIYKADYTTLVRCDWTYTINSYY